MKHRLQFDFTEDGVRDIDKLRRMAGLSTRAELIRYSLKFLQWTLAQTCEGATLLVEKDGRQREVVFPFWSSERCGSNGGGATLEVQDNASPKPTPRVAASTSVANGRLMI